jgi:hypothetical protein
MPRDWWRKPSKFHPKLLQNRYRCLVINTSSFTLSFFNFLLTISPPLQQTMFLRYNLPHIFTAANLLCGCLAIALTFNHHFETATWMIIAASLFDFFDGFVARLLRVEGLLGKQLDSLADLGTSFRSKSDPKYCKS